MTWEVQFVGGPLHGQRRTYDVKPGRHFQHVAIEHDLFELHVYRHIPTQRVSVWCGMWITTYHSRFVGMSDDGYPYSAVQFKPGRDEFDIVNWDDDGQKLEAFLKELYELMDEYGVTADSDGCYECNGETIWRKGARRSTDGHWRVEPS